MCYFCNPSVTFPEDNRCILWHSTITPTFIWSCPADEQNVGVEDRQILTDGLSTEGYSLWHRSWNKWSFDRTFLMIIQDVEWEFHISIWIIHFFSTQFITAPLVLVWSEVNSPWSLLTGTTLFKFYNFLNKIFMKWHYLLSKLNKLIILDVQSFAVLLKNIFSCYSCVTNTLSLSEIQQCSIYAWGLRTKSAHRELLYNTRSDFLVILICRQVFFQFYCRSEVHG